MSRSPARPFDRVTATRIARAFLPSFPLGNRWDYYYTLAKLRSDPLYPGVLQALRGSAAPLLDLGCGLGLLAHALRLDGQKMDYRGKFTQNLSFSGRIQPTKGWNFTFSSSYNFDTHKLAYMNCTITRDLHCFSMSASFVPVGPYKSYNFHIAVKSSLLADLKYDKRSSYSNGVDWY